MCSLTICVFFLNLVCIGEAEINVVLTGVMGSGKSSACNFFFREKVFKAERGFNAITTDTDFHVKMIGGKSTKFVDTPGLLDTSIITDVQFKRLAQAILAVPNGIHALGIVINLTNRINATDLVIFERLLDFIELVPYTFVIFSNAYVLGCLHDEQQRNLEIMLNDSPAILHQLLEAIDQRYIILESVINEDQDYYDTKVDELVKILQSILAEQKKPFTCFLNEIARQLQQSNATNTERIDALTTDLKSTNDRLNEEIEKNMKLKGEMLWQSFFVFVGTAIGAAAGGAIGAALGPPGSAAGTTAGASFGGSAVAAILGGSGAVGAVGAIGGYGIAKGVRNKSCHIQ